MKNIKFDELAVREGAVNRPRPRDSREIAVQPLPAPPATAPSAPAPAK